MERPRYSLSSRPTPQDSTSWEDRPFARRLESRPWFEAGRPLDGEAARKYLMALRERPTNQSRPYCVYVHVPFCASICRYCALYTRAVRGNADAVFDEYIERIHQAIATHPSAPDGGPGPTTVHFGGGTPLQIGLTRFTALTHAIRHTFGNPDACEWALETTTSALTPHTVATLAELGFQRIHLGIQTLDNRLRQHYRRRESGETAIEKIQFLQQQGFRCSVDLIIGLEGATEATVQDDLQRLYDAGIRMFSLCALRQRTRTEPTAREHQEQNRRDYQFWTLIWRFMAKVGLLPIHSGQFAPSPENNLYYTHPARGEECIAIGPYAHGSAGQLYYSNKLLPGYYAAIRDGISPIAKAVLYDNRLEAIRHLEWELLAHHIRQPTLENVAFFHPTFAEILAFWQNRELLVRTGDASAWTVSCEGSWFVGNMIAQARQMAERVPRVARKSGFTPSNDHAPTTNSSMTQATFLIPILDKWLWYAPLHQTAALVNHSAARLLRERRGENLPGELGELYDTIRSRPVSPPGPPTGELIPTLLGIIPTRGCNMHCVYCDFGGPSASRKQLPPQIATAAVDWAAKRLVETGKNQFHIQFFGGEPFVASEIVETTVHHARHVSAQRRLTTYFDASTNGLLNARQCQFIGDYFDGIVLSLDGPPEFQDKYRPVAKDQPSSTWIERTAHCLSEMPLSLCLRMCVTQESVTQMERIAQWMIKTFNPAIINFETLTPRRSNQVDLTPPDPYQFAAHAEGIYRIAEAAGVQAVYAAAESGLPRWSFCPLGNDAVIVSPDGRFSACYLPPEAWEQRRLSLDFGHLDTNGEAFLFPDRVERIRHLPARSHHCADCFCQYTCAGGCHVNRTYPNGSKKYTDFCIQTRLITAFRLLRDLGFQKLNWTLLEHREAMERLAHQSCDRIETEIVSV